MPIDTKRLAREQLKGEHLNGQTFMSRGKKYTLGGEKGNGAIGVVRRATEYETGKPVAVKFLAPETRYFSEASIEDIYRRFKREGERGVKLDNPNLVEIIAYEENSDGENFLDRNLPFPNNPFIIMEFVPGRTLEDYLRMDKPGIPARTFCIDKVTLHLALQITNALIYLHKHSIVHRDVKPANIFISKAPIGSKPSIVKLGDFGIVKWNDFNASIATGTLTVTGQQGLGTLKYMAPEQSLDPQSVDSKSDMYALGITLFELFTNKILRDIHHVIQIRDVRMEKGNTFSRLHRLDLLLPAELHHYEYLMELILDTFLKKSGRPTSTKIHSQLFRLIENLEYPE